jgi:hypothetical protein
MSNSPENKTRMKITPKKIYAKLIDGTILQRIDHYIFYNYRLKQIIRKGKILVGKLSAGAEVKVLNGVFKDLRYPSLEITESALVPKIIGSYEYQLQPWFNRIIKRDFTDIIDVGSAEGYYAVGLATRMPGTTIHCFDINEKDILFSKQMANVNNVRNMTWNTFCDEKTLLNFPYRGKTLIICDCEGYEIELLTPSVIEKCKQTDFLIEMHNVVNPVISGELFSRFQFTHTFTVVNNKDVDYPLLQGLQNFTETEKEFALCEHRGGLYKNIYMEWAYFTPKVPL